MDTPHSTYWCHRLVGHGRCSLVFLYLAVCVVTMTTVKGMSVQNEQMDPPSADLQQNLSCDKLKCGNGNACRESWENGTQIGHASCLCRGQWAGVRCLKQIRVETGNIRTDSVVLFLKGTGPPSWDSEIGLDELEIEEVSITFWNMNRSEDCHVMVTSKAKEFYQIDGLDKGQRFVFCINNGPSGSCSMRSSVTSNKIVSADRVSDRSNCVEVKTKLVNDSPLDVGLIIVPIAAFLFIAFILVFFYIKRHSLLVHFFLYFCCCRACYCCRKRCMRKQLQHIRKQQQQRQQQQQQLQQHHHHSHNQSENCDRLLEYDITVDDSMHIDQSLATTSLSSDVLDSGNRSSIISDSHRSARSFDSNDVIIPPAYQDELSPTTTLHSPDITSSLNFNNGGDSGISTNVTYENFPFTNFNLPQTKLETLDSNVYSNHGDEDGDSVPDLNSTFHRKPSWSAKLQSVPKYDFSPLKKEHYFCPEINDPSLFPPSYPSIVANNRLLLTRSDTFPVAVQTLPCRKKRSLYSPEGSMLRSPGMNFQTGFGINQNDASFESPSIRNDHDSMFSRQDNFNFKNKPPSTIVNFANEPSTFPTQMYGQIPSFATLPRTCLKRPKARESLREILSTEIPNRAKRHSDVISSRDAMASQFHPFPLPLRVGLPERQMSCPSRPSSAMGNIQSTVDYRNELNLPSHNSSHNMDNLPNSIPCSESILPRKRTNSLRSQFEFNLPFLKRYSFSGSQNRSYKFPSYNSESAEINDLTSPLAEDRSSNFKNKRPRPLSLPPGFEEFSNVPSQRRKRRTNARRKNLPRNRIREQKPIFEGHPSLHMLPPFRTEEDEEDENLGNNVIENEKRNEGESIPVVHKVDEEESSSLIGKSHDGASSNNDRKSTPSGHNRNSKKLRDTHTCISSFYEDDRNLVTPFIFGDEYGDDVDDNDDDDHNRKSVNEETVESGWIEDKV